MSYLVNSQASAVELDAMRAQIQNFTASFAPYKVTLSDNDKKGIRSMAEGREGYVRMVCQIASIHINSLAREQNPADLQSRLAYDSKLEECRQALLGMLETVSETQIANSIDIMKLTDDYVGNLQTSRHNNGALDLAMREVDDWNSRYSNRAADNTANNSSPNA